MTASDLPKPDGEPPANGAIPLEARITVNDDGHDEVTLAPSEGTGRARLTRWVTARADSVVLLDEMR